MSKLKEIQKKHAIRGIAYINALEEYIKELEEKVVGLDEYNNALQDTSILNGNLVVKHEETLKEIKTHCIHCDADNRTMQPYEILDIINE